MSTYSTEETCPNCRRMAEASYDSREGRLVQCIHCGYVASESVTQMSLEELNERREQEAACYPDLRLPILDKLPPWNLKRARATKWLILCRFPNNVGWYTLESEERPSVEGEERHVRENLPDFDPAEDYLEVYGPL